MGIARALAGLGRADEAVALQRARRRRAARRCRCRRPSSWSTSRLRAASRRLPARRSGCSGLARSAPARAGAVPRRAHDGDRTSTLEEAHGPISLGAGRLAPLAVTLEPPAVAVAPGAVIDDLSFIPVFRPKPA